MTDTREEVLAEHFDAFHTARAAHGLVDRLYAEAMGDAYPHDVAPYSSCDLVLLGQLVGRLRLRPGQVLGDAGCGTGGVGLWLARALGVRLVGWDVSLAAVRLATGRAARFAMAGRAEFRVGTLEASRLPEESLDGLVCVDAFANADAGRALGEMRRVIRAGGRLVVTRAGTGDVQGRAVTQAAEAGLVVEEIVVRAGEPAMWERLYGLWQEREAELRRAVGDEQAGRMLREAERMVPRLAARTALLVTMRVPG
ncbi:SAM-dependent methyltransferase [Streptomyces sp. NBC_00670]|uniref:SAM-dependent methyltransferase n=1 Tax=Streptomyces sp. NBC_00670 TaxID=2975804 RepID=UPI002E33C9FA|nr:class I SAM-dependent methyltransferase [Streptomyces sp. NBC_00670]